MRPCSITTMGDETMTQTDRDQPPLESLSSEKETTAQAQSPSPDRWLLLYLRLIGGSALFAFLASVMPSSWIVSISEELGFDPFPNSPLTFYLARNLSLLYGFVGATLLIIASDLARYRPLVRYAALGTILFSACQFVVDSLSGLPSWWTWGESGSTLIGGIILYWIERMGK